MKKSHLATNPSILVIDLTFFLPLFQVYLEVNDEPVDIQMKLDEQGAAFFVEGHEVDEDGDQDDGILATSPLPGKLFASPSKNERGH